MNRPLLFFSLCFDAHSNDASEAMLCCHLYLDDLSMDTAVSRNLWIFFVLQSVPICNIVMIHDFDVNAFLHVVQQVLILPIYHWLPQSNLPIKIVSLRRIGALTSPSFNFRSAYAARNLSNGWSSDFDFSSEKISTFQIIQYLLFLFCMFSFIWLFCSFNCHAQSTLQKSFFIFPEPNSLECFL